MTAPQKFEILFSILFLCGFSVSSDATISTDYAQLAYKDYEHMLQGRQFGYAFFDYLQRYDEYRQDGKPSSSNATNAKCIAELAQVTQGIQQRHVWALRVIDAWGSLPAGMLYGRFNDLGNYDECIRVNNSTGSGGHLKGKYCLATIPIAQLIKVELPEDIFRLGIGICVPASCEATQINLLLKQFLSGFLQIDVGASAIVEQANCAVDGDVPLSDVAIAAIVLLAVLGGVVVFSTICDYLLNADDGATLHPLLRACSARVNARQLFRVADQRRNPNAIACLDGIRCLSLVWVIHSHCFLIQLELPNVNSIAIFNWIETAYSSFITRGGFSVDTFFFLSGLLLAMVALREMDRQSGKLRVPLMYLHRVLRLTPTLAVGLLLYMSVDYLGNGPMWHKLALEQLEVCKDTWWATLLYVQNYVYPLRTCLGHTWYLAADMQLYLISPILLIPLWHWGKRMIFGIVLLLLLLWACLFSTIVINSYSLFYKNPQVMATSMQHIYFATHTRPSPWLIGILFGYLLHITKGRRIKISKLAALLGWLLCFGSILTSIFCLMPKSQLHAAPLTTLQEAFYVSLTRIAWPLALCWLVFACIHGYAGPIDGILSTPLWQPLARLSYCMYMIHMLPIFVNAGVTRTNTNFTNYDLALRFWSDYGFTILVSVPLYLIVEAPFVGIEKLIFSKGKQPPKSQSKERVLPPQLSIRSEPSQNIYKIDA